LCHRLLVAGSNADYHSGIACDVAGNRRQAPMLPF
jgi:hypothetical protein